MTPNHTLPTMHRLKLETVEGFINRGGEFAIRANATHYGERWVSTIFNARKRSDTAEHSTSEPSPRQTARIEDDRDEITLWLETVVGNHPTRAVGGFSVRPEGSSVGNRWVSNVMNVRPKPSANNQ